MSILLQSHIPNDLSAALEAAGYSQQRLSKEALKYFAVVLYAQKSLTLEQSARLAQMPLWKFIPFLAEQNVAVADYPMEEVEAEMETVTWLTSLSPK